MTALFLKTLPTSLFFQPPAASRHKPFCRAFRATDGEHSVTNRTSLETPSSGVWDTVVVGAGVVGLAIGTQLARRGVGVAVLDELPPASGASYGNSGFLVSHTAMPMALPGMYRKVPSWLMDPEGPLRIRPSYIAKALPFIRGWLWSSRKSQVLASSDAMKRIHRPTFEEWKELVGPKIYDSLIRRNGQVYLWEGKGPTSTPVEDELRAR
ncbi:MAG: FAD-dependent oxidoreductase, partial [Verrucomicrobiaceae bacterium]